MAASYLKNESIYVDSGKYHSYRPFLSYYSNKGLTEVNIFEGNLFLSIESMPGNPVTKISLKNIIQRKIHDWYMMIDDKQNTEVGIASVDLTIIKQII